MKYEIRVLERVHKCGLDKISRFADLSYLTGIKRDKYLNKINNTFGVIIKSKTNIDKEFLNKAKNLKVVLRAGTGLDNIDLKLLKEKKIKLISAPQANAISAAEFTIMQILLLCRRVPELYPKIKKKDFRRHLFEGRELGNLSVGIIGMGNIGYEVAKRLKPFGCKLFAFDKNLKNRTKFKKLGGKYVSSVSDLIPKIDVLTLHCNLNNSSRNILGNKEFNKIKKSIILINCARAELIKNEALIKAIKKNKVSYASIDVINPEPNYDTVKPKKNYKHSFLNEKKIFYTPHLAASTIDAQKRISNHIAFELKKFLKR